MPPLLPIKHQQQVTRDAQIDCALAEVYQRSKATEAAVAAVQQHEAVAALFDRLVRRPLCCHLVCCCIRTTAAALPRMPMPPSFL